MTLVPDEQSQRLAFTVDMTNPKPVGTIRSTGIAGPWTPRDPGELPVEGDYHFDHADLSTIKGIAGILSSTGHYTGTLRKIEARRPDRDSRFSAGAGVQRGRIAADDPLSRHCGRNQRQHLSAACRRDARPHPFCGARTGGSGRGCRPQCDSRRQRPRYCSAKSLWTVGGSRIFSIFPRMCRRRS